MTTTITARPAPARSAAGAGAVLRRVLLADAAVTGANGVAYLAGATTLDGPLGPSAATLRPIGAFLVAVAAVLVVGATRRPIPAPPVRRLMAGNALWVVASLVVAVTGALGTTGVGTAWVVLQAAAVAGFVALQRWALARRA